MNPILFTPGPVNINPKILEASGQDQPYFRNLNFSQRMLSLEALMLEVLGVPEYYKVIFVSGSGTAAMEMSLRSLSPAHKLLSIETGLFSQRATAIAQELGIDTSEATLDLDQLAEDKIEDLIHLHVAKSQFSSVHYTYSETSTGALISPNFKSLLGSEVLVIVDAVTALFTENIDFSKIDILYSASQKGIACHPGVGFLILSPLAQEVILRSSTSELYLNPKSYLLNGMNGQTPFTPSLSVLSQIHLELKQIQSDGGYASRVQNVELRSKSFRNFLNGFGIQPVTSRLANCVTNFQPPNGVEAATLVSNLAAESIFIAPNPPSIYPGHVRVAHFGHQTESAIRLLESHLSSAFGNVNA